MFLFFVKHFAQSINWVLILLIEVIFILNSFKGHAQLKDSIIKMEFVKAQPKVSPRKGALY